MRGSGGGGGARALKKSQSAQMSGRWRVGEGEAGRAST